jgi:hypothetical protein
LQLFSARGEAVKAGAIEAVYRYLEPGVQGHIGDPFHILSFATGAVFGAEDGGNLRPGGLQQIDGMVQLGIDARRMANHTQLRATDLARNFSDQDF